MLRIDQLINRHLWTLVLRAPADEVGAGNTGGDAGAGDNANAGTPDAAGVTLTGGTAASEDNPTDKADPAPESGGDTTDDKAKPAEDGEKADDAAEAEADATYEAFTLPDGFEVDTTLLSEVAPVMKELGLNQEQAQKLVDGYAKVMAAQAQESVDLIEKVSAEWVAKAKADPEIGGSKWDETVEIANAAVRQFATKEFIDEVLVQNKMGNHPEVIRVLARMGRALADDKSPSGNQTDTSPAPAEAVWYGATTPNAKKG